MTNKKDTHVNRSGLFEDINGLNEDETQLDVNGFEICIGDTVIWTDPDGGKQSTHQVTSKNGDIIVLDEGTEVYSNELEVVH